MFAISNISDRNHRNKNIFIDEMFISDTSDVIPMSNEFDFLRVSLNNESELSSLFTSSIKQMQVLIVISFP